MKNNFIAKNMNRVNHSSIHIDKKKEELTAQEDIEQGLEEIKSERKSYGLTREKAAKISLKTKEAYLAKYK